MKIKFSYLSLKIFLTILFCIPIYIYQKSSEENKQLKKNLDNLEKKYTSIILENSYLKEFFKSKEDYLKTQYFLKNRYIKNNETIIYLKIPPLKIKKTIEKPFLFKRLTSFIYLFIFILISFFWFLSKKKKDYPIRSTMDSNPSSL